MTLDELRDDYVGRWVMYTDALGREEVGRIKSWNAKYIFAVFKCNGEWSRFHEFTGQSVNPEDLTLLPTPHDYQPARARRV